MMNFFGSGLQTGMGGGMGFDAGPSQSFNMVGRGAGGMQQPQQSILNRPPSMLGPRFGMQPNPQMQMPQTDINNRTHVQMPGQQQGGLWQAYNSYR